jgi:hypothetical protein
MMCDVEKVTFDFENRRGFSRKTPTVFKIVFGVNTRM